VFSKAKENFCPLIRDSCLGDKCKWFIHIRGKDPQSGGELDLKDCAVKWLPTLLIEGSKESRHTTAAVESFRNETVEANKQTMNILLAGTQTRLITNSQ
jgi:hypothetical protein